MLRTHQGQANSMQGSYPGDPPKIDFTKLFKYNLRMKPYFYQFDSHLLDRHARDSILSVAKKYADNFIDYVGINATVTDNNGILSGKYMPTYKNDISQSAHTLLDSIAIPYYPIIIRHKPNVVVPKHIDDAHNKRFCVISIPLAPINDYPPTLYWNKDDLNTPVAIAEYIDHKPCLLNTEQLHSVENTSNVDRLNFQICFGLQFETVIDLIYNKKLFKI